MKTSETTIGGVSYRLFRLNPVDGARLATRVGAQLAAAAASVETVGALIQAFKARGDAGVGDAVTDMLGTPQLLAALAGGVAKVDADELYTIGLKFAVGNVFADVKLHDEAAFNRHFEDHPENLLPVLVWAIRENCAGFFGMRAKG